MRNLRNVYDFAPVFDDAEEGDHDAIRRQPARPAVHAGWQRPAREHAPETPPATALKRTGVGGHIEP